MNSRLLSSLSLSNSTYNILHKNGFHTKNEVLQMQPVELSNELNIDNKRAVAIMNEVRGTNYNNGGQNYNRNGRSALEIFHHKRSQRPIFTLNKQLDEMLGGGVPRGEVTEFCGVPGMGKTQLAIQLACAVQIPHLFSGCEGKAIYIDTEGSFMADRVMQIAQGLIDHLLMMTNEGCDQTYIEAVKNMTTENILDNIYYIRVYDYIEQIAVIKSLESLLKDESSIRLLIIDSVAFHFRRDFDDMALRARLLTGLAQDLSELAEEFDLAVVLTNQVTTRIRTNNNNTNNNNTNNNNNNNNNNENTNNQDQKQVTVTKNRLIPALGESWAHACTNRCMLKWKGNERVAELIKSPSMRASKCYFAITSQGLRGVGYDMQDSTNMSRKRQYPENDE